MYRNLFRFAVFTVTILAANLLTSTLSNYFITFRHHMKPVTFTIIGMAVTVLIFYPLFVKLEELVEKISMDVLKRGRTTLGKYVGLIFSFLVCLVVLIWFYAKMWYHIDLLKIFIKGDLDKYI